MEPTNEMKAFIISSIKLLLAGTILFYHSTTTAQHNFSFANPISQMEYSKVLAGQKAQIIVEDVNRALYQCRFTEQQRKYREEEEQTVPVTNNGSNVYSLSNLNLNNIIHSSLQSTIDVDSLIRERQRISSDILKITHSRDSLKLELLNDTSLTFRNTQDIKAQIVQLDASIADANFDFDQNMNKGLSTNSYQLSLRSDIAVLEDLAIRTNALNNLRGALYDILLQDKKRIDIVSEFENKIARFLSSTGFNSNNIYVYIESLENRYSSLKNSSSFYRYQQQSTPNNNDIKSLFESLEIFEKEYIPALRKLTKVIREYANWIDNENNFKCIYTSSSLREQVDVMNISVEIEPLPEFNKSISGLQSFRDVVEFRAKRGFKFDISAGLAFHPSLPSGFSILDDNVTLISLTDSTTKMLNSRSKDWYIPSPLVLTNVYWRRSGKVNFGASVGAGTDFSSIAYYLGLSLLLGREDQFVITLGTAIGKKKVLKTEYELALKYDDGVIYKSFEEVQQNSPYHDTNAYRLGSFISLSYNFTARSEKMVKDRYAKKQN